jgi:hypothetical protein
MVVDGSDVTTTSDVKRRLPWLVEIAAPWCSSMFNDSIWRFVGDVVSLKVLRPRCPLLARIT